MKENFVFLTIGKTQESKEAQEFKRYIGIASSTVLAVNPNKKQLDEIFGSDQMEPEYVVDTERGKEARIHFIVKTDAGLENEVITRLKFTLRNAPVYSRDETKVQVLDNYGNSTWANVKDAEAGKKLLTADGKEQRIDSKYRMACVGEADLVDFLKTYLGVPSIFNYINGSWVKNDKTEDGLFTLERIEDYFHGDFSELREAIALQPNNKVKLLYGVRTFQDENGNTREYQTVASRGDLILPNNAGEKAYERLEKKLADAKASGAYPTTTFKVAELQEYVVEATNLENPVNNDELPWQ